MAKKKIPKRRQSHDPAYYRHLRLVEKQAGTEKLRVRILRDDLAEVERILSPYVEKADSVFRTTSAKNIYTPKLPETDSDE